MAAEERAKHGAKTQEAPASGPKGSTMYRLRALINS